MKKVLGIFCHPDDEILFGWPIFQNKDYERHLIICCDDSTRNRPGRLRALQKVCQQEGIYLVDYLSEDNDFYALPTRRANYLLTDATDKIVKTLNRNILSLNPDYIFTHNPVGEYGHGSHRLLFELVSQSEMVRNLLITDICQESNHRSSKMIPDMVRQAFYKTTFRINFHHKLDRSFYVRCKAIYNAANAWSWNKSVVESCNLFLLKENG